MLKFNSKDRIVTDATLAKQIAGKEKSEVLKQLDTSINGLSPTQAKKRLERDGLNEVSNKECHPRFHFFYSKSSVINDFKQFYFEIQA